MHKNQKRFPILTPLIYTALLLALIFAMSALIWISISDYTIGDFFTVLQLILSKCGSYSALLSAIVATVFFQSYVNLKNDNKDRENKIKSIGHYALYILEKPPIKNSEMSVRLITDESDFQDCQNNLGEIWLGFLTSRTQESFLKNIMAFDISYFEKHQQEIITDYLNVCQKIEYVTPLFVKARSFQNNFIENNQDTSFSLKLSASKTQIQYFWVTAITEDGVLYLNKVKIRITADSHQKYKCDLLQQTNYYVQKNQVIALVQ